MTGIERIGAQEQGHNRKVRRGDSIPIYRRISPTICKSHTYLYIQYIALMQVQMKSSATTSSICKLF